VVVFITIRELRLQTLNVTRTFPVYCRRDQLALQLLWYLKAKWQQLLLDLDVLRNLGKLIHHKRCEVQETDAVFVDILTDLFEQLKEPI
jgi:hypothetical protein